MRLHSPCSQVHRDAGDVFQCLRWDPDEFVVYRIRVEFPVVPSSLYYTDDIVRKA